MSMRQGLHMGQRMSLTQTLTPQMRMNLELIQAPSSRRCNSWSSRSW